ncbi:MAG: PstS family phosphate ABC transporter substrate-binding protein [Actinomycetota bacterium]
MPRRFPVPLLAAGLLALAPLAVAACGDDGGEAGGGSALSGSIVVDGSSTVAPLTSAAAEAFNGENPDVNVDVRTSGTGGGFEVFCTGETDISDASRAIKDEEVAACTKGGVEYTEVRVASDGITVVTGADAEVGTTCLTLDQLKTAWAPDSKVGNWKDIDPSFTDVKLSLAGPGSQSGTYDFFNEEVLGEDAQGETVEPRQDYSASEDDNVTVRAVTGAEAGMGYFGYSYFAENQGQLKAFELDGGSGCVAPSPETITGGEYPLSRPLFIYVSKSALERPEVKGFVRYYVQNAVRLAEEQRFVPAPQDALDASLAAIPE